MRSAAFRRNLARCAAVVAGALGVMGCAARPSTLRDPAGADAAPRLVLAKAVSAEAAPVQAGKTEAMASTPVSPMTPEARTVGWVIFGVGAQAALVGIATSFMMLHQNSVRDGECNAQKVCSQAGLDANAKISALAGWNAGAWAVAAAGVGVGAFLVITNPTEPGPRTAVGIAPNGSGVGLDMRSQF